MEGVRDAMLLVVVTVLCAAIWPEHPPTWVMELFE